VVVSFAWPLQLLRVAVSTSRTTSEPKEWRRSWKRSGRIRPPAVRAGSAAAAPTGRADTQRAAEDYVVAGHKAVTTRALLLCASSGFWRSYSAGNGATASAKILRVTADGPLLTRVDDGAAELGDALECRGQVGDVEVQKRSGVAGPGPRLWTPRRRPSVSASHPAPAPVGREARSTPRIPCQKRRA